MGRNLGSEQNRTGVLPIRFVRGSIPTFGNPHGLMQPRLQIVASQFVGQTLQERAGKSEWDGIKRAIEARDKSRKH